ncbi:MAG: flagellar hook-basal body complex protein FliE [Phycisphaerae bacterium]|jgi:flagellar hook-basal body complex protein FliE
MADPLGFINAANREPGLKGLSGLRAGGARDVGEAAGEASGASFRDVLKAGVEEVNRAQQEATRAVEDLATGRRGDIESVVVATQKADNAFRMLQQLRNRMVEAYDEIKQMRV